MSEAPSAQVLLNDPLSEVTRKERRSLLGASTIGIAMVKAGLLPTKISALGIEVSQVEKGTLLLIIALIVFYFLFAFVIYGTSDFLSWRLTYLHGIRAKRMERERLERRAGILEPDSPEVSGLRAKIFKLSRFSTPTSALRATFEFVLPVLVGLYTVLALLLAR